VNFQYAAAVADAMIRSLHCAEKETFQEIFGENHGKYLWSKMMDCYPKDEGGFLCYLDDTNKASLAIWAAQSETNLLGEEFPVETALAKVKWAAWQMIRKKMGKE
jgi:hypothetical protein